MMISTLLHTNKRKFSKVFISLLVACIMYWLICIASKYYATQYVRVDITIELKEPLEQSAERVCKKRICGSVLKDGVNGQWVLNKNIGIDDIEERERFDAEIRKREKWPEKLYRQDNRCGPHAPIEGFDVLGQCDPRSSKPCCNLQSAHCGSNASDCMCNDCIDSRNYLPCELADWRPKEQSCQLKRFRYREACQLLGDNISHLLFTGDSLIRQLFTTFVLFLTNDYQHGALPQNATSKEKELCSGEFQITDHECRYNFPHSSQNIAKFCDGNPNFVMEMIEHYKPLNILAVDQGIKRLLGHTNTYVILSIGLHFHTDYNLVVNNYLKPLVSKIKLEGYGWPKLVWLGIQSVNGFLRKQPFYNDKIKSYNTHIHTYLEENSIPVIDFYNMSRQLRSYDDLHYTLGFNMHKIQIIMNYFEERFERCER